MTEPPLSLTEEAHRRIRSDIIEGRIRPNVHLVANDLAQQLEISRTPIREALQLLASEGLVVATRRGFVVREHSPEEIRHIYEVRAALEEMAARLAAERATADHIATLEQLGAHTKATAGGPREVIVDLNDAFHEAIMVAARNPRLRNINQRNSEHFFNYNIAKLYSHEEAAQAIAEHATMLKAIKKRDGDAAAKASREHVMNALEVTLQKLR
ncbi:GntR family transcriptional regulator [Nocardioides nitrophenolicus]|uniref:GntR family transcriptional regulator n=1 Tax=Nocardioides nitrophenolicus TaxID=60489 RepID=UPI00195D49C8|nr:GntR family transcriptional regulator [Nocardioides nitrophenolicus]MBM7518672.1 DNA-binding GntR family transcriptional regulator [Nocardioides nitrophenolicus]